MDHLQERVESWIRGHGGRIRASLPRLRWPWQLLAGNEKRRILQEEYRRKKKQLESLVRAVRAESVSDLQDILCCIVLSECVYKRPASEMVRFINKFKADFGGEVVALERVQPSLDHVPHRYLLAENGDTLFASFIGTKQYKDVITDVNILQGAIFHDEVIQSQMNENGRTDPHMVLENDLKSTTASPNSQNHKKSKPAAHRGFLARAKGIPGLELYRLAQKKNRRLVLCGHSLGGAVAVLATLHILRVIFSSSTSKEQEKVQIKCITFSQPPVGNGALRDYVHTNGWHNYFKTYCIPEDLVPRILSPAYFRHYSSNASHNSTNVATFTSPPGRSENKSEKVKIEKQRSNEENLVLGLGPLPRPIWRLSKLVPLEGFRNLDVFKWRRQAGEETLTSNIDEAEATPQPLEIQEGSDGISLTPIPEVCKESFGRAKTSQRNGVDKNNPSESRYWRGVPSLPSYVPFGQLFLLGNSSVDSLSVAEYSKLTSVQSVFAELKERFRSHSMRSYRARFQRVFDLHMGPTTSPVLGMEQLHKFPHLQQWLGLAVSGVVELGHIVEPPVIRTATSIVPLGWGGLPGEKNGQEPLKVDIQGYGLHLCSLVQAQVNGSWCSTTLDSLPPPLPYPSTVSSQNNLQKIRVLIGAPLRQAPKQPTIIDSLVHGFPPPNASHTDLSVRSEPDLTFGDASISVGGLSNFVVHCTNDFFTVSKEVHLRTRRVRLLGLEGAGKTSLYNAIVGQNYLPHANSLEIIHCEDPQEGVRGGLCYSDSVGVNLQELSSEARRLREELWMGTRYLSRKIDLIVLVHNLSHKIPQYRLSGSTFQPALSLLLDETAKVGIPWILAITNIFSVSADRKSSAINSVLQAYQATTDMAVAVNSCPYIMPGPGTTSQTFNEQREANETVNSRKLILSPVNFVRRPFQKKPTVLHVEGVTALCQLIHRVLLTEEEAAFEELARERLYIEAMREQLRVEARKDAKDKMDALTAAAVGASLGGGLGLVLAVVMGAASALRKP